MERPFLFSHLPAETRNDIYKFLFAGEQIHIDLPVTDRNKFYHTTVPTKRSLPGILLVSKTIRYESLPLFLSEATPVLYLALQKHAEVPSCYFGFARRLVAKGWHSWLPSQTLAPLVKELEVEDCNDEVYYAEGEIGSAYDVEFVLGDFEEFARPNYLSWVTSDVQILLHARFTHPYAKIFDEAIADVRKREFIEWRRCNSF